MGARALRACRRLSPSGPETAESARLRAGMLKAVGMEGRQRRWDFARRWIPLRGVWLLLDLFRGEEAAGQVLGVFDDAGDDEIGRAVVFDAIEKFCKDRVGTVGDAVLSQVARFHVRGDDFEAA